VCDVYFRKEGEGKMHTCHNNCVEGKNYESTVQRKENNKKTLQK